MKYVENPRANEKIKKIIEDLRDEIITFFHPNAIILTGSFGRGEGTVTENNGKLNFLSDCEITIIPYTYIFNRKKIDEFELNFRKRTGLKVEIWGFAPTLYFLLPFLNKMMKPTIANYELKFGSVVIYGKNYLKKVPEFKPQDIPYWEGIRLILNRIAEALSHFSFDNPSEEMVFWTDKIVLACQDALLLSMKKYHYSYKLRNQMFTHLFQEHFGELSKAVSNSQFQQLTRAATRRKLSGDVRVDNPIQYWFNVTQISDEVFRYLLKRKIYANFDYLRLNQVIYNVCKNFHNDLEEVISGRYLSSTRMYRTKKKLSIIYSAALLIYFSLSDKGEVNRKYLDQALRNICEVSKIKMDYGDSFQTWNRGKDHVVHFWHQICR